MNTKARLLFVAVAGILILGGAEMVMAGTVIDLDPTVGSISIAPSSIPVPETGSPNVIVGMNKVQFKATGPGQSTSQLEAVRVQLISNGILNPADIASIRVWFEGNGGNGLYDNGIAIDDINVVSGGPYTFSANPVDITLDSTKTVVYGGQTVRLYVAIELTSVAATAGATVGVQVIRFTEGGRVKAVTGHGVQKPLDKYRVGLTVTGDAPVGGHTFQGASASILKLVFDPVDNDASTKINLASVKVHQVGSPWTADTDINPGGVVLYEDTDTSGSWNAGDAQVTSTTLGPADHFATLTLSTPASIPAGGKTFFVVINIASDAVPNDEVEFQIDNPSSYITFSDAYADDLVGGADFAGVPAGRPYTQKGYLTGAAIVPSGGNATIIDFQASPPRPIVNSKIPGANAYNQEPSTYIEAVFSKDMDFTTIDAGTFKVQKGTEEILGNITNDGSVTARFTPQSSLEYGTTYTVRILGGPTGVLAINTPKDMLGDEVWSFTTKPAEYPQLSSAEPAPGSFDVSPSATVRATFTKIMNTGTIGSTSFLLFEDTDKNMVFNEGVDPQVPGCSVAILDAQNAKLDPHGMKWNTTYWVVLRPTILDDEGLALTQTVFRFTTEIPNYPRVSSTVPSSYATNVLLDAVVKAIFSKEMDKTSVEAVGTFTLKQGATPVSGSVFYDDTDGLMTATFTPSSLDPGKLYTATVTTAAIDTVGLALNEITTWSFTTAPRPQVTSTTPWDGATGVLRSTEIKATFSKQMDTATLDETTFTVLNHGVPVLGTVSWIDDWNVEFAPSAGTLVFDGVYTLTIDGSVESLDQIPMNTDMVWSFETVHSTNPVVSSTNPIPFAAGVIPDATITITFTKPMDPATFEDLDHFLLRKDGTGPDLAGSFTITTTTAVFDPDVNLDPGETYIATLIAGGVKDTDGYALLSDKTWEFTTTPRPEVILKSPAPDSVGVSRTTNIKAVFSKDMDDATINEPVSTDAGSNFIVFHDENDNGTYDAGDTMVPGTVVFNHSTLTATFTLIPAGTELLFLEYRALVKAGVQDTNGITMDADETWTFTTVPSLTEPVAANNRITPTSTDPVTIFIPQPPADVGGASAKVTVQVFTATGKKVATLINNQAWSAFEASLPLTWNGTNGLGEPLGPGLYFIQIRATSYLRTLKVMIVR